MSSEPWDDQNLDPDVVAFGLYLVRLGQDIRAAAGEIAESIQWLAHAYNPAKVPCPHRLQEHKQGGGGGGRE